MTRKDSLSKTAGPVSRLLALLGDFSLGLALFFYFNSFELFRQVYLWVFETLEHWSGIDYIPLLSLSSITFLLITFAMTLIVRFYGTLVLGSSLFQWALGIRGDSSFLWNRVGGCARVALEFILAPFLIFDLKAIKHKQTLKEVLTFTHLKRKPSLLSIPVAIVVVPLLLFSSFYTPLLQNLTLIDGIKVSFTKEEAKPLNHQTHFSEFKEYSSNNFSFSAFSSLAEGRLLLIPGLDLKRAKKKRKISPFLHVYDSKNNSLGKMKMVGELQLIKLLELGAKGNPLFSHYFPEISKILRKGKSKYRRVTYKKEFNKRKTLNPIARKEIKALIRSAFELSMTNLIEHTWSYGPFIHGLVLLRRSLVGKIDKGSLPNVDFVTMGNYQFLRLRQNFSHLESSNQPIVETLIPIDTLSSSVIRLSWGPRTEDRQSRELFKNEVLATANWYFDYNDIFKLPSSTSDFSAFSISDYLIHKKIKDLQKTQIQDYTFSFFYKHGARALEDTKFFPIIKNEVKRILFVGKYKSSGFKEGFKNKMLILLDALNSNDKSFFSNKESN